MMDCTKSNSHAIIHHILSRKSAFIRKAAGTDHKEQVVAANIDNVFICMSLTNDFNARRLERYLSVCWDSGAVPVVVLTKADLCKDIAEKLLAVSKIVVTPPSREVRYFQPLKTVNYHRNDYAPNKS